MFLRFLELLANFLQSFLLLGRFGIFLRKVVEVEGNRVSIE